MTSEIASRFMPTLWLTLASMSWAVLFGMAAGIAAAVWRNRWPDRLGMALAVTGISFPAFALGMLLMQVFRRAGLAADCRRRQLAALYSAVVDPWRRGGIGDGALHPRVVRRRAA